VIEVSWSDAVIVVVGCILIATALIAGRLVSRRGGGDLMECLADPDASVRLSGLAIVERDGVSLHAAPLLDHVAREQDPLVLESIRQVVARHSWEPIGDEGPGIELRRWASSTGADQSRDDRAALLRLAAAVESAVGDDVTFFQAETATDHLVLERRAGQERASQRLHPSRERPTEP
jgi:hypothetical protein